jgi:hypothetical protein
MLYQPRDSEQQIISDAIQAIPQVAIFNTTASGQWVSIVASTDTLSIILQPRDPVTWFFSTSSGGSYFTIRNGGAIQTRLVVASGTAIGWVSANQSEIFELMQGA